MRTPTLSQVIAAALDARDRELRVSLPARIEAFDTACIWSMTSMMRLASFRLIMRRSRRWPGST